MSRHNESSVERLRDELQKEINKDSFNPYERNHRYKVEVSKNDAEKEKAKQVKSRWKQSAKSKYGPNWKKITRQNGYGGI